MILKINNDQRIIIKKLLIDYKNGYIDYNINNQNLPRDEFYKYLLVQNVIVKQLLKKL